MISFVMLKILEYSLLPIIQDGAEINSRRYGFHKESSCTSATNILKENLPYYRDSGSNVHSISIDFSKTFDRLKINS